MLVPVPECSGTTTVLFMDAAGSPVHVRHDCPMPRAAKALDPVLGELTFLPDSKA
jgi:hypothetical protein